jgi:hypothetical protein
MLLPIFQTTMQEFLLMQNKWSSILNVLIGNPSLQSSILTMIPLKNGKTVVNHLLGKKLTGWRIIRQRAEAQIYDQQDSNQTPELTLVLVSNAAVTIDLEVF